MSTFKHGKWARSVSLVLAAALLPALSTAATLTVDGNSIGTYSSLTSTQVDAVTGNVTINTSGYTSSGGTGGGGGTTPATTYTIGGTVTGLSGGSVTLLNNGSDSTSVSANGSFSFSTPTSNYSVSISSQPSGQTCTVANGSGTASADVTNVSVTCAATPAPTATPANVTVISGAPYFGSFFDLGPNEIKAFAYNPAASQVGKRIATVQQSSNGATRTVWVSTSPGGSPINDTNCTRTGTSTTSYYTTVSPRAASYYCLLSPGVQYYVNVQNATSPNGTTSTCTAANCGFVLTINGAGS